MEREGGMAEDLFQDSQPGQSRLDLSMPHIDGSQTPAYRGGEDVEYQGRKKRRTANALFLTENQAVPLAMAAPKVGNHADLYEIEYRIDETIIQLSDADISVDGLFCNLDAGFDGKELRSALISHGIIPNVCPNPRNGGETIEDCLYDEDMHKESKKELTDGCFQCRIYTLRHHRLQLERLEIPGFYRYFP
jgi:hypothetical protein